MDEMEIEVQEDPEILFADEEQTLDESATEASQAEDSDLLPIYILDSELGEVERKTISRDLDLYEGDGRLFRLFEGLCEYTRKKKSVKLQLPDLFKYLLSKSSRYIKGESNLSYYGLNLLEKLEKARYCDLPKNESNKVVEIILQDPLFSSMRKFLNQYYATNDSYDLNASHILHQNRLPNTSLLADELSSTKEKISALCLELSSEKFDLLNVEKAFRNGYHLKVNFHQYNQVKFDILFANKNNINAVITQILIPYLVKFERENNHFEEALKEKFLEDKKFSRQDYRECTIGKDFYNRSLFLRWLQNFQKFVNSPSFFENYHKYVSPVILEKITKQGTTIIETLRQTTQIVYFYLFNLRKNERSQRRKLETFDKDQKQIVRFLIEKSRFHEDATESDDPMQIREASYKMISYDAIRRIPDELSKKKLGEKYSRAIIEELLDIRDQRMPKIYKFYIGNHYYYVHRWRIIDVFYAETQREAYRLSLKIIKAWAKLRKKDIPASSQFKIHPRELGENYRNIFELICNVMEASESDNDLVSLFYPSPSEIGIYKLTNSDLANPKRYNEKKGIMEKIKPIERIHSVREIIYKKGNLLNRKELKDILGINYESIMENVKKYRRRRQRRTSDYFFKGKWRRFLFNFTHDVENLLSNFFGFFSRIGESSASKKSGKKSSHVLAKAEITKHPSLASIAEKFNVPSTLSELKEETERVHKKWNNVILEAKNFYPNWNKMSIPERDKAKQEIKIEERRRRQDAKAKVDAAIKKVNRKMNLKNVDERSLMKFSRQLAAQLRKHNREPLANYIKMMIISLNSD